MPLAYVISLITHTPLRTPASRHVKMAALDNGKLFLPKRRSVCWQRPMQRTPGTVAGRPDITANCHATLWRPLVATDVWLLPMVADFVRPTTPLQPPDSQNSVKNATLAVKATKRSTASSVSASISFSTTCHCGWRLVWLLHFTRHIGAFWPGQLRNIGGHLRHRPHAGGF